MMGALTKATKTFSLDRSILADVKRTKGDASESERVNQLLRAALDLEKKAALDREAADFFARANRASSRGRTGTAERKERRAFQKASLATLARD
jgi:hypothetical protein